MHLRAFHAAHRAERGMNDASAGLWTWSFRDLGLRVLGLGFRDLGWSL